MPTNTTLNAKTIETISKMPNITNLATGTVLTSVKNKIPDHRKVINTPEFNKLKSESFVARLA